MSDQSTPRTVDTIHKEYSAVCAQAGHVSYQIFILTNDLEILHKQARDLNTEATQLQAAVKAVEVPVVEAAKNE